jgi:hypothetical protein
MIPVSTDPDPERERKIKDDALALKLLGGTPDGLEPTKYLKPNSRDERIARAALARRVRDLMGGYSGELLA